MRILLFTILILCIIWLPFWVLVPYCVWYAYRYFAWELIVLASFIDAYFGGTVTPYYSLAASMLVLCIEWVRPSLAFTV